MYIVLTIISLATLLSFLQSKGHLKHGLDISFILITIFWAIRYDWGNDYDSYLTLYNNINESNLTYRDWDDFYLVSGRFEKGWVVLNILFRPIGFFGLVIFLSILENFIIYRFIKKYVSIDAYWFAVFIYTASTSYFCVGASMMREWLAISLVLLSYDYIIKKNPILYFSLIMLASTMHVSAIIMIPFYFIGYLKEIQLNKKYLILFILVYIIFSIIVPVLFTQNIDYILSFFSSAIYSNYIDNTDKGFAMGNTFMVFIDLYCLVNINRFNKQGQKLVIMCALSCLTYTLTGVAHLIDRVGLYFQVSQIAVFPMVFISNKNRNEFEKLLLLLLFVFFVQGFVRFFYSPIWGPHFLEYHTIFSTTWK